MCLLGQTSSSIPVVAALSVEFAIVLLSCDSKSTEYPYIYLCAFKIAELQYLVLVSATEVHTVLYLVFQNSGIVLPFSGLLKQVYSLPLPLDFRTKLYAWLASMRKY